MKFKDFLAEKAQKKCVFAFGRMNPPTTGHAKLVEKVKAIAKENDADHLIVLSHSHDSKKNPLSAKEKLKYVKAFFPGINFSVSSSEQPNFLAQAASLYKKGVTELHMVGGSDRTSEYERLLNRYNNVKGPHGHFNFAKIQVHSAGERDPDAEGVEGMSASKMREAASKSDFAKFKQGVPSNVSDKIAREMMMDVRKGMGIKENFENMIQVILSEGVHDKGIFKAMFLAGGPGSGKDYVLDNTLAGHGLTEINSDKALEFLMDKKNLDKKMPESEKELRNVVRGRAKDITELRQKLALLGRNGLIINGTGDDPKKIARIKKELEELGYETGMVMVNTADEVSKQRNIERGQRGGRTVPEEIRKEKWDAVQAARPELAKIFGDKYREFDNSEDLRTASPEIVKAKKEEMLDIFKGVQEFVKKPAEHPKAKEWIAGELSKKDTLGVPRKGTEMVAPHGDTAADEARKLGLQYYGYGRYGKNGKVTHHSVHGKLVQDPTHVQQQKMEKKAASIPVSASSQPLKIKESLDNEFEQLFEAITVSVTADTPEELKQAFGMLTGNGEKEVEEETNEFSDTRAFDALTLGKKVPVFEDLRNWFNPKHPEGGWKRINSKGEAIGPCAREPGEAKPKCMSNEKRAQLSKKERASAVSAKRRHDPNPERKGDPINVSNYGKGKISEEYTGIKKIKYNGSVYVALNNRPRIYILRNAAAKDAHRNNGEVIKAEKGYMVKLKESLNVQFSEEFVSAKEYDGTTSIGWSNKSSTGQNIDSTHTIDQSRGEEGRITITEHCGCPESHGASEEGRTEARSENGIAETSKKTKITLSKIKENFKQKINEIDKGIEPGLSMAGAGESIGRDMGEKINKKGKVTPIKELTGDETGASIGDQKADELQKKGISLSTFKKRNYL